MLSNSLVAGVLAMSYVVVLVLQLNPSLSLAPAHLMPLVTTVGLFYAVHLTAICYVLLVARQLLAAELFSPAWVSVGVLVWLGAAASAAGSLVIWGNLRTFSLVLERATVQEMATSAIALAAASVLFTSIALVRARVGARGRLWYAFLVVLVAGASVAVPLALRGRGTPSLLEAYPIELSPARGVAERTARVTIIAVDAGSLDFIASATAEGRLPNFGRVLDAGSVMHLATLHPTSAEAVWAAVATGKLPQKNGIRSAADYRLAKSGDLIHLLPDYCFANGLLRLGFLVEERHTARDVRVRPLWSILTGAGLSVGVVGWPLTDPAPAVNGYLVSDSYLQRGTAPAEIANASGIFPPDLEAETAEALDAPVDDGADAVRVSNLQPRFATPSRVDRARDRLSQILARTRPAQVTVVRYQSLDPIGHYFLRYAVPSAFGDVTEDERRRLGGVLERHYAIVDEAIGRAMTALGPEDLLLVVSGYGMEPLTLGKRLLELAMGDPDLSGTHEAAPDGFLMAYGAMVARHRSLPRAHVVDVVPTVLYFLGLSIGRDMDGYARTDLFQPAFTEERPITFIPTYDR
jgi:type I phosphodiesterase/nucleotide pyrophosphatase